MKKFLYGLVLSFFLVSIVLGQTIYDYTDKFSVSWTPAPITDCSENTVQPKDALIYWEVIMVRGVTGEEFRYTALPDAVLLEMPKPKSGVYTIKVRAVSLTCCDGTSPCNGGWAVSTDPMYSLLKGGTPGSWKIRFKPSGPTGPIIIY